MRVVAALCAAVAAAALWLPPTRVGVGAPALSRWVAGLALGAIVAAAAVAAGSPVAVGVAAGCISASVPAALASAAQRRAARRDAGRWPDYLAAVRSRIAGGSPLPDAARAAARHIGGRFEALDGGLGIDFARHVEQVRSTWADPVADRVLSTLVLAATVGGGRVDDLLRRLAASIADEFRLRRAHDAAVTQQRVTAAVALLAPWAILGLSLLTNPTAADAYATPTGTAIVIGGLAATGAGYALAARIIRLARQPRVFR